MKKILFVCTGNTFRSFSAERILQKILHDKRDDSFQVSSAGTLGNPIGPYAQTYKQLAYYDCDDSPYQYRILNKAIVDEADIIVCMSQHHRDFIKKNFGRESYLFNGLALDEETDLQDDDEASGTFSDLDEFIQVTVKKIQEAMPKLYAKLKQL